MRSSQFCEVTPTSVLRIDYSFGSLAVAYLLAQWTVEAKFVSRKRLLLAGATTSACSGFADVTSHYVM